MFNFLLTLHEKLRRHLSIMIIASHLSMLTVSMYSRSRLNFVSYISTLENRLLIVSLVYVCKALWAK